MCIIYHYHYQGPGFPTTHLKGYFFIHSFYFAFVLQSSHTASQVCLLHNKTFLNSFLCFSCAMAYVVSSLLNSKILPTFARLLKKTQNFHLLSNLDWWILDDPCAAKHQPNGSKIFKPALLLQYRTKYIHNVLGSSKCKLNLTTLWMF